MHALPQALEDATGGQLRRDGGQRGMRAKQTGRRWGRLGHRDPPSEELVSTIYSFRMDHCVLFDKLIGTCFCWREFGRNLGSLQGPPDNDPLDGFSHIEPRASTRRVQQPNAAFMAPPDQIATVMTRQIIQNEQHAQGRVHPIQLLSGGKRIPLLPSPPFWDFFWSRWALLEDGLQFPFEPGMQDGIRARI